MTRYLIKVAGKEYDVVVEYRSSGNRVILNGCEKTVIATGLGGTRTQLLVDNRSYEVEVRADSADTRRTVLMRGVEIPVEIENYNLALLRQAAGLSSAPGIERRLRAPMPGLVLDVKVAPGDKVNKGDPLVIVEAMKMENVLKAAVDATVTRVLVKRGASVEKNDVLVEFE